MSERKLYDVSLYASRRLRNPNHMGEHEESLRSLVWTGRASSMADAAERARAILRIALRALEEVTDKALPVEDLCVDHIVEMTASNDAWPSLQFGEAIIDLLERTKRRRVKRLPKGAFDVHAVLESGAKILVGQRTGPIEPGAHVLCASVSDGDGFDRQANIGYANLAPHGDFEFTDGEVPWHIEVLQVLAAVYRLADPKDDEDGLTEGEVHLPESATLAAAAIADLRRDKAANGALAARFLRAFGFEAEARASEAP